MIQAGKIFHTFTGINDVCEYFKKHNYRLYRYSIDAKKHVLHCEFEKIDCDSEVIPTLVIITNFRDSMELLMKLTEFMGINNDNEENTK